MPRVYVVSKASYDFSLINKWGPHTFVVNKRYNPTNIKAMMTDVEEGLKDSKPDDYVLLNGLPVLQSLVCITFVRMHGKLNVLIFNNGEYMERRLDGLA
jgi:hypothetical protein